MELACTLILSHSHLRIPKAVTLVAQAGFAAFDLSPCIPRRLTRAAVSSLRTSLRKNNLAFSGFVGIYPPNMTLASPHITSRRRSILYTKELIELAHSLGGRSLVWGSGRSRSIPSEVPHRKGYAWLVELLKASAPLADEMNIKIAIEPLYRLESTIIHTAREALSLARSIDHSSVGIVYDTFHASIEEDSFIEPILLAGRRLAAVHVSDCNRKIPGKGHIDFPPIFDALKKVGYDGYVTLEAILGDNVRQELVAARKYLQKMID
jgi:sugar phosphate isomerase/epimerase